MFCYQCEQTAFGTGCVNNGICGKKSDTSDLQDELVNKLIVLANCSKPDKEITKLIVDGLFITLTNVNYDNDFIKKFISRITERINCDFKIDIQSIFRTEDNRNSLKSLILFGLKGTAAYYHHANVLGYSNDTVEDFFYEALKSISKNKTQDELISLALRTGDVNLRCMELLDRANRKTFGNPQPEVVSETIEKGPFIIVSGHDLYDLKMLLEQTKGKGVNVYTHGEMLTAHSYPKLKEYSHLKGNFGTAWQNQRTEFDKVPAAVLFTANCIMPPKDSYIDRVFTSSIAAYPETTYVGNENFSPVIEKAIALGGYDEDKFLTGINGGNKLTVGFGHTTILQNISKITELIKSGKLRHIFLVGGCDGAKPGRNYYTDFVKLTPSDTLILTLACGKYRFNDLDLGTIEGIPRLLDMGQCNDAYGAILVACQLAKSLEKNINDLPLSFILSWYEQKAVGILLSLFYLGIKNIKLGPTLPAFISNDIKEFLVEKFNISPITNPQDDLNNCLSQNHIKY